MIAAKVQVFIVWQRAYDWKQSKRVQPRDFVLSSLSLLCRSLELQNLYVDMSDWKLSALSMNTNLTDVYKNEKIDMNWQKI